MKNTFKVREKTNDDGLINLPQNRLAIFLPELSGGGAQRIMLNLAAGIAGKGYPVDLVLAQAKGPYITQVPENVRLVDLKSKRVLTSLPAYLHYLRHEQPVAVLSSLHVNIIAIWAKCLSKQHYRLIVTEHNTRANPQRPPYDFRVKLMPQLIKYSYPYADRIVAVSKGVADDLALVSGIPRENIQVIYNPIVTPDIQQKITEPFEHPWFSRGEPPVILGVGRLTAQKDFSSLIQAFSRVRETRHVRLIILGEGDERDSLESLVHHLKLEKDVFLPGFVYNPYPYMAHSSVFVLSSRWEGLPTVLVEAMYCGIPVIATDCPSGPREILADGKFGQLVPVGDISSLSRAIINAFEGKNPLPAQESWLPYTQDLVVNQYIKALLEG